jgi:hypothetical protein
MKKERVDKLTAALEGAGFEVVSLKEETHRHLLMQGLSGSYYAVEVGGIALNGGPTGIITLEIQVI